MPVSIMRRVAPWALLVLFVLVGDLYLTGLGLLDAKDINYFGGPQRECFYLNMHGVSQRQIIRFGPDADTARSNNLRRVVSASTGSASIAPCHTDQSFRTAACRRPVALISDHQGARDIAPRMP
jgi:hypothetical protein